MNLIPTSFICRFFVSALMLHTAIASVNAQENLRNSPVQAPFAMQAPANVQFQRQVVPGYSAASKVDLLRGKINTAPTEETRLAATEELTAVLAEEFDTMHAEQTKQIEDLRARLEKAESVHKQRLANKDEIVQRRIEQLIGTPAELQWNADPSIRSTSGYSGLNLPAYPGPPANRNAQSSSNRFQQSLPGPNTIPPLRINQNLPTFGSYPDTRGPATFFEPQQVPNASSTDIFDLARAMATHRTELEHVRSNFLLAKERYLMGDMPLDRLNEVEMTVKRLEALIQVDERQVRSIDEANQQAIETQHRKLSRLEKSDDPDRGEVESTRDSIETLKRRQEVIEEIKAEMETSASLESKSDSEPTPGSPDQKNAPK